MIYDTNDTIIACSTGTVSNSAIGVIRISGVDFLEKLSPFLSITTSKIKPRYAHFCNFISEGKVIDEIILTYFKAPHSYNGEDIIELAVHGNQLNINRIINIVSAAEGFRKAHPGEFSYRALQNKKLNLSQVEGLDLLLNASSIFSLDQGMSLMSGKLQADLHSLYKVYLNHKSALEFGFDFLEDVGEEQFNAEFTSSLHSLKEIINRLYRSISNQNFNLIKPEITLFGPPNAGKSSLFNILLGEERAITSHIAGTTRDFIKEDLYINETIFSLIDTAGVRITADQIESEGVKRALKLIETSFYKILLINPFDDNDEFISGLDLSSFDLILYTHADRAGFTEKIEKWLTKLGLDPKNFGPIEPALKDAPIEPRKEGGPIEPVLKSAPIEPGSKSGPIEPKYCSLSIEKQEVRDFITTHALSKYQKLLTFNPILIQRHSDSIKDIYNTFTSYENLASSEQDMAIIASELNILGHCISELIGIISPDDVLHNIFDNFCIGK